MSAQYPEADQASLSEESVTEAPLFPAQPIYARSTAKKRRGVSPALIAVPVIALAIGGAVFFTSPQGGPTEEAPLERTVDASTSAAAVPPAANPVAPAAGAITSEGPTVTPAERQAQLRNIERAQPRQVARAPRTSVRPAARAPSAADSGAEASATVPGGPVPYSQLNGQTGQSVTPPAAPPAPLVETPAAPAETTTQTAPEPATPPVDAAPEPQGS
jgi:hypothetical protein